MKKIFPLYLALILSSCVSFQSVSTDKLLTLMPGDNIRVEMKSGEKIRSFRVVRANNTTIEGIFNDSTPRLLQIDQIRNVKIVQTEKRMTFVLVGAGLLAAVVIISYLQVMIAIASIL